MVYLIIVIALKETCVTSTDFGITTSSNMKTEM